MGRYRKITIAIMVTVISLFIVANFTGAIAYAYDNKKGISSVELKNSLHPMFQSSQITPLTTTISNFTPDMIRTAYNLKNVIDGYLMVAPDQAIWTERGYVNAENLTLDDSIYNVFTHNYMQVFSIKISKGSFTMYDFTISVNGNFIAYFNIMKDIGGIHAC
ncbi:MAG: hypothetical protein ACP5H0_07535 [Caldisericum sp.]|uniref:hypothetical protein n=1 Tax=Caldisericum sp. TaxID=2499687 RepID=UPI003D0CE9DE